MTRTDLNLLVALDVLLSECSVTVAARRLGLSASAMSRTLARLRAATGDPLLVQAGRALVATPYADSLRDRVHGLAREVQDVLSPTTGSLNLSALERTFTIRANEGFMALLGAHLASTITCVAPRVLVRFSPKPDKDAKPLREGLIDLEIGALGASAPEVRSQLIFRDRFVGAARADHPLFDGAVTAERYAACRHVVSSRRGVIKGPVDQALSELGLVRQVVVVVPGFPDAVNIARRSDLVALVPRSSFVDADLETHNLRHFELPVRTPSLDIAAMWHPRLDNDQAHRWLRETVISECRKAHASL